MGLQVDIVGQNSWLFPGEFLDHLDPHILLIHEERTETGHKLILRFENGLGVEILQSFLYGENPPFFRVSVLRFLGPRMEDFRLVQYTPFPEVNWVNTQEEIIHLCQQVARLPAKVAA